LDELSKIVTGAISLGAMLAAVVIMVLRGDLVTRKQLQKVEEDRDYWRNMAMTNLETNRVHAANAERLMAVGQTTEQLMEALGRVGANHGLAVLEAHSDTQEG
jgi:hypothetical protein